MYLFVWSREGPEGAVDEYRKALHKSIRKEPKPIKDVVELCQLVAQYFIDRGIITSLSPRSQRITTEEWGWACDCFSTYATKCCQEKRGEIGIWGLLSSFDQKEIEIGVKYSFYLDVTKKVLSLDEAYNKYPPIVVQDMAIFPGLWAFTSVREPADLDTVLPKFEEYVNLTMRYEELVAGSVQRFRGALKHDAYAFDSWPYETGQALILGYVPFDTVKRIQIGETWGEIDYIRLLGLPPIEVVMIPVEGKVPFYPTGQPGMIPALTLMDEIDTIFVGDMTKIVAWDVSLLLDQNLSRLGFDEYDKESVQQVGEMAYQIWKSCVLEDCSG